MPVWKNFQTGIFTIFSPALSYLGQARVWRKSRHSSLTIHYLLQRSMPVWKIFSDRHSGSVGGLPTFVHRTNWAVHMYSMVVRNHRIEANVPFAYGRADRIPKRLVADRYSGYCVSQINRYFFDILFVTPQKMPVWKNFQTGILRFKTNRS